VTALTGRALVRAADRLRDRLQDPRNVWVARRDPDHDVLQFARTVDRDTADYFGAPAILACAATETTLRRLSAGMTPAGPCRWCAAIARSPQVGKLPPVTEASLALLGDPCDRCVRLVARIALAGLEEALSQPTPALPSAVAAAGKPPPPSYYRPRPVPWPADARRPA
jgi:hypothetical protein